MNFLIKALYEYGIGVFLIRSQAPQISMNELISLFKLKAIKAKHFATAVLKFTVALWMKNTYYSKCIIINI